MKGARGTYTMTSGDEEFTILFTNRAIADAEEALGKGIVGIAEGLSSGSSGIRDIVQLLRAGLEAARKDANIYGKPITVAQAYEVMDKCGFVRVSEAVMIAISAVLSYDGNEEEADPNE